MEPLRDDELDDMLRRGAPDWRPSAELDERVRSAARPSGWRWLLQGSIRVPVPVALGAFALVIAAIWLRVPRERPVEIDFEQFQPVRQLEIKLARNENANQ